MASTVRQREGRGSLSKQAAALVQELSVKLEPLKTSRFGRLVQSVLWQHGKSIGTVAFFLLLLLIHDLLVVFPHHHQKAGPGESPGESPGGSSRRHMAAPDDSGSGSGSGITGGGGSSVSFGVVEGGGGGADGVAVGDALGEQGSNVILATGSVVNPFVQGTFYYKDRVARLTVFDAELLRGVAPDGFTPSEAHASDAVLSLLAFMEDDESILSTMKWWGFGFDNKMAYRKEFEVSCHFWPGHSSSARSSSPLFTTPASMANKGGFLFYFAIRCPLPAVSQLNKDQNEFLFKSKLQVQLVASDLSTSYLYLPPIPLQRADAPPPHSPPLVATPSTQSHAANPLYQAGSIAACIRPYHSHSIFFHLSSFEAQSHHDSRLLTYLNYNLLKELDRIYLYNRFPDSKDQILRPYKQAGFVVEVPFPSWSEVFYRPNLFKDPLYPRSFPTIYDQILHVEHCAMQGRRNGDDWLFFVDTDEFLLCRDNPKQSLKQCVSQMEEEFVKSDGKAGDVDDGSGVKRASLIRFERDGEHHPLAAAEIERFQFLDSHQLSQESVLSSTRRCPHAMQHIAGSRVEAHAKTVASPQRMLPLLSYIHKFTPLAEGYVSRTGDMPIIIFHYFSAPEGDRGYTKMQLLCRQKDNPKETEEGTDVEDTRLVADQEKIDQCLSLRYCRNHEHECGRLCSVTKLLA